MSSMQSMRIQEAACATDETAGRMFLDASIDLTSDLALTGDGKSDVGGYGQ